MTLRHLFHIVHLEVFAAYERSRFAGQVAEMGELVACKQLDSPVAVEDVVRQFFFGAAARVRGADSDA